MAPAFPFTLPIFVLLMIGSVMLEGGFVFLLFFFSANLATSKQKVRGRYLQKW